MKQLGSKPLQTARLDLRPFRATDFQQAFDNWMSDPSVTKYLTWTPARRARLHARASCAVGGAVRLARSLSLGACVAGDGGSHRRSLGRGGGYALGAGGAGVLSRAGILGAGRHDGGAHGGACLSLRGSGLFGAWRPKYATANAASGRVLEKCGMKQEGILRRYVRLLSTDEWTDVAIRAVSARGMAAHGGRRGAVGECGVVVKISLQATKNRV